MNRQTVDDVMVELVASDDMNYVGSSIDYSTGERTLVGAASVTEITAAELAEIAPDVVIRLGQMTWSFGENAGPSETQATILGLSPKWPKYIRVRRSVSDAEVIADLDEIFERLGGKTE